MKKCPWCEKKVPTEEQICHFCGFDFSRGEMSSFYDQLKQKQAKKKLRHKNEMVIVALFAIAVGGSYIFNNHQEQTEAQQNIQQTTKTISGSSSTNEKPKSSSNSKKDSNTQLSTNMKPNEFVAAVANYAAQKNISKWKDIVENSEHGILIRETTKPEIVNYLSAKGTGTVYVAFNGKASDKKIVYSAYTINQDGSVNIYEFGTPNAPHTGNIYDPIETVSQQDLIKFLNSHRQVKNVQQMTQKVRIAHE